jgi:hypothetical protein
MRRRRWLALVPVTVLVAAAWALWPTGPRLCRATFDRVEEGMSRGEVIATVGRPPGVYSDRPTLPPIFDRTWGMYDEWVAHDATMRVYFDGSGRAYYVEVTDAPPRPSLLSRLRSRFGL